VSNFLYDISDSFLPDNRIAKSTVELKDSITYIINIKYNINQKLFDISMRYIKINVLQTFKQWVKFHLSYQKVTSYLLNTVFFKLTIYLTDLVYIFGTIIIDLKKGYFNPV
jgi:hypothetical protein